MGKYEPLARYLKSCEGDSWSATFAQVEAKLGFALPRSALEYPAWWSNQKGPGHSQKEGWQSAGWETRDLDLERRTVRFVRSPKPRLREIPQPYNSQDSNAELWERARSFTGLEDRTELERHVLTSFIRREAARALSAMGGTMPDFEAPPRRRFK